MTDKEQLYAQYDDALAALVMNAVADAEGENLLRQAQALSQDEMAAVPEALRARNLSTIRSAQNKIAVRRAARKGLKWALRLAAVLATLLVLLVCACAVSESVRISVLNYLIEHDDRGTTFRFDAGQQPSDAPDTDLLAAPETYCPEGFVLTDERNSAFSCGYLFSDGAGGELRVTAYDMSSGTGAVSLDTEDAVVTYETIGEQKVMMIEKQYADEPQISYQLTWVSERAQAMFVVSGDGVEREMPERLAASIIRSWE